MPNMNPKSKIGIDDITPGCNWEGKQILVKINRIRKKKGFWIE